MLCSILTIVLLVLAALTFGMSAANYDGNLMGMMFFSIVGIVISRLLIKSASSERRFEPSAMRPRIKSSPPDSARQPPRLWRLRLC